MTIRQAQSKLKQVKRDVRRERVWAVDRALKRGLIEARIASSGPLTGRQRRQADYPYATRHGAQGKTSAMPGGTPAIVNVGRGVFRRGWQIDPPRVSDGGNVVTGRLMNLTDVADYLQYGTKKMVARPIKPLLEMRLRRHLENEMSRAQRRLEYAWSA